MIRRYLNVALLLMIVLENLFLFVFMRHNITSQPVNSTGYFICSMLIGIIFLAKHYGQPNLLPNTQPGVVRKWVLYAAYAACLLLLNNLTIQVLKTTKATSYSDIIPAVEMMTKSLLSWRYPYGPDVLAPAGVYIVSNYLPAHWLPYCLAEYFHFDYRSIAFAIWCIGAVLVMIRSLRGRNLWLQLCVPLLLAASYLLIFNEYISIIGGTVETMIAGYYMALLVSLGIGNFVFTGIAISFCLLSRYYVSLWLPLWAFVLFISGQKKELFRTIVVIAIVFVLLLVPFLIKDPMVFFKSIQAYQRLPYNEWGHLCDGRPCHLYMGVGIAYAFYEKYHTGDLYAGYLLLQHCFFAAIALTIAGLALWYAFNKARMDRRIFLQGSFKIYLSVFLFFIPLPYMYLIITANFVSIALFAEQLRYSAGEKAANPVR